MKIIKPSVHFFGELQTDYASTMKFIEMAGRTCYKSEGKITEDSAEGFVGRLVKAGHLAMVEHSNFVAKISRADGASVAGMITQCGKYLNLTGTDDTAYVGGNLTAWFKTHQEITELYGKGAAWDDSMFKPFFDVYGKLFGIEAFVKKTCWEVCPQDEIPAELHRYAVKFICDRGVSHELVRHRPCSFAQESTRYVNYGGKDMEFIEPAGYEEWRLYQEKYFEIACRSAEGFYNGLLAEGFKPQQARAVLPNALKTEIVVTADAKEWAHIRKLRTDKAAHPDIQRVMNMIPWEDFL